MFSSLPRSRNFQPSPPAADPSASINGSSEVRFQLVGSTNLSPLQSTFFRQRKAAESARHEAGRSGAQPSLAAFLRDHWKPAPGARSRGSLQGDAKRARVDPPRTEAGRLRAVPPFPPTTEGSGLPASLFSNLGVYPLRFHFSLGQRTAKREAQEAAVPSPGRAWGTGNNLPGRTPKGTCAEEASGSPSWDSSKEAGPLSRLHPP